MNRAAPASMRLRDAAVLVVVAFMWATNNVGAHIASKETHPIIAAGVRFLCVGLLLIPWLRIDKALRPAMMRIALISGPLHFGLLYMGFSMTPNIGAMTVVIQMWVPIATLIAIPLLGEYPTRQEVIGLCVAFAGILIMSLDPHLVDDWRAALMCFGACLCWGTNVVLARRTPQLGGLAIQGWMSLFTGPVLLLAAAILVPAQVAAIPHLSWTFWGITAFAIFGSSLVGNVMMYEVVRRYRVSQSTPLLLLASPFALISGVLILGERIGVQEMIGGAITLGGILLILRSRA